MNIRAIYIVIVLIIITAGCESARKAPDKGSSRKQIEEVTVPSFNSDTAYAFIQKQVNLGPRVPNTSSHQMCGEYLVSQLRSYGAEIYTQDFREQAYNGTILNLRNIIGSFNPDVKKRIVLAAHWDTRPFADKDVEDRYEPYDGANDGGSGVGILLEVARILHSNEMPKVGIDIIFFDGEDYGEHEDVEVSPMKNGRMQIWWCLGSQYWAFHPHKPNYSAYYGILFDMAGAKKARFYREGGSMQFAPKVTKKVWNTARNLGYSNYFIDINSPGIMDDHIFVNRDAKIPMIAVVEYDPMSPSFYFGPYHHTHRDNMNIISKQTLQAVGETVVYTIYNE